MKIRSILVLPVLTALLISLESFAAGKIALKVLYAGHPGSAREKDFVTFLEKYVATVGKADLKSFTEDQAKDYDVVIIDYDGPWKTAPRPKLGPKYSKPTMTVGMVGSIICKELKLKTAYF